MKILIIDDSKVMRAIVKRTLRQAGFGGHEIQEASNGVEGMEAVGTFEPDLILCDWNMPQMNGIELLKELRGKGDETPFGFVTSEGMPEMRQEAVDAGAKFLIVKPFTADDFEQQLGSILAA
ncbi:MAG: response regulator [Myxococcales bacterium FL481]|nr:MAG: response regulator [Myxococcales bacterium FL481]